MRCYINAPTAPRCFKLRMELMSILQKCTRISLLQERDAWACMFENLIEMIQEKFDTFHSNESYVLIQESLVRDLTLVFPQ
jgi:hypothetical protein